MSNLYVRMKKKILIIHETMNGGGAEKVLCDILSNFDYSRYYVDLLLVYKKGTHLAYIPKQVTLLSINEQKKPLLERVFFRIKPLLDVIQKRKIRKLIKPKVYDTIVSFMEGPAAKYHSFIKDFADNNVSWIHTDLQKNHWSSVFWKNLQEESFFYRSINNIACVSLGAKNAADALFNLSGNSFVLYNLIDWNEINEKAQLQHVQKNKFTVCNVGRLAPQKRQERIIEVAALLKDRGYDIDFWILGTGVLESALKDQVCKKNLTKSVHFLGFQTNPYPYIKAADVFLLTSDAEGYPLVVCEALCLGKAIVSTNVAGVEELLGNQTGILTGFAPYDIAKVIEKLKDNSQLVKTYSERAIIKGKQFDVSQTMDNIYSIL